MSTLLLALPKTPERAEYAHFSLPYRTESVVLYVVKGTAPKFKFKSLPELKKAKFRLGAARNNYYGDEFDELMKQPEFKQKVDIVKSDEINFRKLMRGRIDGFLVDPVAGAELRKKYRYLGEVEIHPAHIYSSDIFVMLSRKSVNEEYVDAFNSSLIELKTSGRHKAILDKYLN